MPIIAIRRPSRVAKKIDIKETDTVKPSPDIKKSILDAPSLLKGDIAYQPQL
jgi:hypothetical protein